MRIIEPAPIVETSASSTLLKMNYIAFIALSLMSVQAGKIYQVFYELYVNLIQLSREPCSVQKACDMSNGSAQYALKISVQLQCF